MISVCPDGGDASEAGAVIRTVLNLSADDVELSNPFEWAANMPY